MMLMLRNLSLSTTPSAAGGAAMQSSTSQAAGDELVAVQGAGVPPAKSLTIHLLHPPHVSGRQRIVLCVDDTATVDGVLDRLIADPTAGIKRKEACFVFAMGQRWRNQTLLRDIDFRQYVPHLYVQARSRGDEESEDGHHIPRGHYRVGPALLMIARGISGGMQHVRCSVCHEEEFAAPLAEGIQCSYNGTMHFLCYACSNIMLASATHNVRWTSGGGILEFMCPVGAACGGRMICHDTAMLDPAVLDAFKARLQTCVTCGSTAAGDDSVRCAANHTWCDECLSKRVSEDLESGRLVYDGALTCTETVPGMGTCRERVPMRSYLIKLPRETSEGVLMALIKQRETLISGWEQNQSRTPDAIRTFIQEQILNLRCPHCRKAFLDHDNCPSVTCSTCSNGFCARCLRFSHFCPGFDRESSHEQWHTERRARRVISYLCGYDLSDAELTAIFDESFKSALRDVSLDPDMILTFVTMAKRPSKSTIISQARKLSEEDRREGSYHPGGRGQPGGGRRGGAQGGGRSPFVRGRRPGRGAEGQPSPAGAHHHAPPTSLPVSPIRRQRSLSPVLRAGGGRGPVASSSPLAGADSGAGGRGRGGAQQRRRQQRPQPPQQQQPQQPQTQGEDEPAGSAWQVVRRSRRGQRGGSEQADVGSARSRSRERATSEGAERQSGEWEHGGRGGYRGGWRGGYRGRGGRGGGRAGYRRGEPGGVAAEVTQQEARTHEGL